jgi:hypothetical protein
VFCRKEQKDFDDSAFYDDPRWGFVHNVKGDLHTVNGTPVHGDGPGPVEVPNPPAAPPPSANTK